MWLHISEQQPDPLYEQVKRQLREQIIYNTLPPDSALPSIRKLAKDLNISVITVKRAYQDLEQEEWIYTQAGRGTFVRGVPVGRDAKLAEWEERLENLINDGLHQGIASEEIINTVHALIQRRRSHHDRDSD
ncbi:GntR family transcriptional regulator [Salsuginibacillus kocurii]|uniref:GntR family transcriptional regulator n=1 Tax=Salsuginibacillus kocurii TaxID=427078 RepID=UPI00035E1FC4|nr:GntR family transcriptional regulator [Salsuginibacillus kocurii]